MKIIHCADLHLDSKMESNLSREQALERRTELYETFRRMVEYAEENGVGVIIIAGDLFDMSENIGVRVKQRVLSLIREASDIDFIYLRGNHDCADFFTPQEKPENLKTFSDGWESYEYGNVVITGREFPKIKSASEKKEKTGAERFSENDAEEKLNEKPAEKPGEKNFAAGGFNENELSEDRVCKEAFYHGLDLRGDRINIVVLHGQESEYSGKNDAQIINLPLLKNRGIDYLALGHLHSYKCKKLDDRGVYCYSGCLEGRGFDECGRKGFVLIETDGLISHRFIPFAKREFHAVRVELSGEPSERETEDAVSEKIKDIPEKDLVKLILTGEVGEDTDIDTEYLGRRFAERFYFLKIYDETKLMINYEAYENDISLKGEFIRAVRRKKLKEEDKREIILLGLRALSGRETDIWK